MAVFNSIKYSFNKKTWVSDRARHGKINLNNVNYESDSSPATLKWNYHNSKLMNVMFSQELSRRWANLGITAYSNHPGLVRWNST